MKSNGKLFVVFGIIFALIIGFVIGISVNSQKVEESFVLGTIGKINDFKKVQNGEAEMDLKNELLSDTAKLQAMQKYLYYYYALTAKMERDVRFAINEANGVIPFRNLYQFEITALANYGKSLSASRTDLLLALRACLSPEKTDPLLLGELLNQANNTIARLSFRNRAIINFIDILASYTLSNKALNLHGLYRAHDLLTYNEFYTAFHTADKMLTKSTEKRQFLTDVNNKEVIDSVGLKSSVKQDLERLAALDKALGVNDAKKPGMDLESKKLNEYLLDTE